jgi:hypothetical protein
MDDSPHPRMVGCFRSCPLFEKSEQFLLTLGCAGGVCDCEDINDSPESLEDTTGWMANFEAICRSRYNCRPFCSARTLQYRGIAQRPESMVEAGLSL